MRASTENIVGVLNDLGSLHLNGESPWGEVGPEEDAFLFDDAAEARGDDLSTDDAVAVEAPPSSETQAEIRARLRRGQDLNAIASRLGTGAPPPLPDPDALAWYQPVHYFAGQWGVYVREAGITMVAEWMARFVVTTRHPLVVAAECQRMAHVALRLHETFHHKIESAAIRLEVITRLEKYHPYDLSVFLPLRDIKSDDLLEEALANAWMFRNRNTDSKGVGADVLEGLEAFLGWWIPQMPFAYRRGIELASSQFFPSTFDLTCQVDEAAISPARPRHQWAVTTHLYDPMHNRLSKHYIVVPIGEVPYLPVHGKESRGLSISTDELVRMLKRLGWECDDNRRGRHPLKMIREGRAPIPVPVNREALPIGTLKSIAKQAGFQNERALVEAAR